MNSTPYSSVRSIGGVILIASSLPDTRKLVSCLVRVAFTTRSLSAVDADDHAFVHRIAGPHEHAATVIEFAQGIGEDLAVVHGDQHAVLRLPMSPFVRPVAVEDVGDQARTTGQVQEFVEKPIRPRAGMRYSRRTRPRPSGSMFTSSPYARPGPASRRPGAVLRCRPSPSRWVLQRTPSISLKPRAGLPTASS